jgi:TPP-dependent 2-oxoacid decarboxylase
MPRTYTVREYLLERLAGLGVRQVFGVAGDYNLGLLECIASRADMTWVGTANELNAAYAADGYARTGAIQAGVQGAWPQLGAVVTTLGVGELSAFNGIAGSYAESVPVVQITGAPATSVAAAGADLLHHTFSDGDLGRFARAYTAVTCASAWLTPENAAVEIDRVLRTCLERRRPVHLTLQSDVGTAPCAAPSGSLSALTATMPLPKVTAFANKVRDVLAAVSGPDAVVVLAGPHAVRPDVASPLRRLVREADLRAVTLHRGKGALDESHPRFLGLYAGELSGTAARDAVEKADVIIAVGGFSRAGVVPFSAGPRPDQLVIDLAPQIARVGDDEFAPVPIGEAVRELAGLLTQRREPDQPAVATADDASCAEASAQPSEPLGQQHLWSAVGQFLRPGDLLIAESGTSYYGALGTRLPHDAGFLGQGVWASIGYGLPATLGAQLAAPDRRAVLVIGDGAFQFTAQELGTFARHALNPVIIVVDNDGYSIERALHGPEADYNDIVAWDWARVPAALGLGGAAVFRADTVGTLRDALSAARDHPDQPTFIQAVLPRLDVPPFLSTITRAVAARNAY